MEGKNDALALRDFADDFLQLNNKNSQNEFLNPEENCSQFSLAKKKTAVFFSGLAYANIKQTMENRKAILMFDADKKGLQLGRLFKTCLQQNGTHANNELGRDILKAAKVRHAEHLHL